MSSQSLDHCSNAQNSFPTQVPLDYSMYLASNNYFSSQPAFSEDSASSIIFYTPHPIEYPDLETHRHNDRDLSALNCSEYDGSISRPQLKVHVPPPSRPNIPLGPFPYSVASTPKREGVHRGPDKGRLALVLHGDLQSMCKDWTQEELEAQRRVVHFQRSVRGNTITATFQSADAIKSGRVASISCIWWKQREAYYITTVDIITLLAALLKNRFTVEEKNRIRRKFEGFQPETVSKQDKEKEMFFNLIMDFPEPKPRKIQKNFKVVTWLNLEAALKKVVRSYVSSSGRASDDRDAEKTKSLPILAREQ